jgi:hypothetical protein
LTLQSVVNCASVKSGLALVNENGAEYSGMR